MNWKKYGGKIWLRAADADEVVLAKATIIKNIEPKEWWIEQDPSPCDRFLEFPVRFHHQQYKGLAAKSWRGKGHKA